ncbi:MAG: EthD domain-containing protein [Chloroflexi bacterium]|nr:EthD domain-containing protein [Chloroflexota bacterium]
MYKMIFGAKRKPGMSREAFGEYWTTTHANKARKVPGISRYVINLTADLGGSGRELAYDGFAEAWFEDDDAMRRSGRSPELKAVLEDEVNLFDLSTRFSVIVEEHLMIADGTWQAREPTP